MSDVFTLPSPRTILRPLRSSDAAAMHRYRSLPEVARYQSWTHFSLADAEALIARQQRVVPDTPDTWLQLAITLADTHEMIGDCGIHFLADRTQVELGITLSPEHQRRGLAREAIECVLRHLFETLGKHRVYAITDAENAAAARLFTSLGFRRESHYVDAVWFKGAWGSEFLFAMLRREWQVRSGIATLEC